MTIYEFRRLTPDAKLEYIFSRLEELRATQDVANREILYFREIEDQRRRLRRRRQKGEQILKGES